MAHEAVRAIVPAPAVTPSSAGAAAPRVLRDEQAWAAFLAAELRAPVGVVYTRSRKTPVAVRTLREPRGALEIRLHKLFGEAPPHVHGAVASWIRSGSRAPRACAQLDAYIAEILRRVPPTAARRALVPRGEHHDLERLAKELMAGELAAEFPDGSERPHIGWGRRAPSRTRRSLRLGSYDADGRLVRIHPVLDQPAVPDWFVRYVVFHELLHAVFPVERGADDRWIHHGRAFRRRERAYPDHRRALSWERAHLNALIRSARTGKPMAAEKQAAREEGPRARRDATPPPPSRAGGVLRVLQQLLFPER